MEPTVQVLCGDALKRLRELPSESVQCCVTSPPYWRQRDNHAAGQIGLEADPNEYVKRLVRVFREVRRVLKPAGTLWLNLGDSYAGGGMNAGRQPFRLHSTAQRLWQPYGLTSAVPVPTGLKPKDMMGIPWRVAFALQADGWWLRSDIIWHKPNPAPEPVRDRPTKTYEHLFLLAKSRRYFYDADAIREHHQPKSLSRMRYGHLPSRVDYPSGAARQPFASKRMCHPLGRNKRDVWMVTTRGSRSIHHSTFPEALVKPCVLAGSKPGDLVLDPFAGSGTTLIVALRLARRAIGIDLNPEYVALTRSRVQEAEGSRDRAPGQSNFTRTIGPGSSLDDSLRSTVKNPVPLGLFNS
ncbi:MAG: site-specific DNA-methyltransferase [Fimbriimonadales bacterium]